MSKQSRRLDDRIRQLCAKVVAAKDSDELHMVLPELKSAIHESVERLRIRAIAVLTGRPAFPADRRKIS
jgi:hypothetical protein